MSLLPFSDLPAYAPRRFVPSAINLGDWAQISPLFDKLECRLTETIDPKGLEQWLLDCGELYAAIEEEGARRYIAMSCHNDNSEAEKAYLEFIEKIEPELKPRSFKLDQLYLAHPTRQKLPPERYREFDRHTAKDVELFRPENVPLETEE